MHTFDKRKGNFGKMDGRIDFCSGHGRRKLLLAAARDAIGIDWITKGEINEAVPPAYTEYIGRELLNHLTVAEMQKSVVGG